MIHNNHGLYTLVWSDASYGFLRFDHVRLRFGWCICGLSAHSGARPDDIMENEGLMERWRENGKRRMLGVRIQLSFKGKHIIKNIYFTFQFVLIFNLHHSIRLSPTYLASDSNLTKNGGAQSSFLCVGRKPHRCVHSASYSAIEH